MSTALRHEPQNNPVCSPCACRIIKAPSAFPPTVTELQHLSVALLCILATVLWTEPILTKMSSHQKARSLGSAASSLSLAPCWSQKASVCLTHQRKHKLELSHEPCPVFLCDISLLLSLLLGRVILACCSHQNALRESERKKTTTLPL